MRRGLEGAGALQPAARTTPNHELPETHEAYGSCEFVGFVVRRRRSVLLDANSWFGVVGQSYSMRIRGSASSAGPTRCEFVVRSRGSVLLEGVPVPVPLRLVERHRGLQAERQEVVRCHA